jgi:hypothetical protein
MTLRDNFPDVDVVNMHTATGPLYHLLVAGLSGLFAMGTAATQVVGALFSAALAALAVWHTRTVPTLYGRVLAVAPLLLSAYFWQSSLWMMTDDAAILFALAALMALLAGTTTRHQLAAGLLIAAAIATRQTFVWTLIPACATCLYSLRSQPPLIRASAIGRVAGPGAVVLAILVMLWGGLTPPAMRGFNAFSYSWVSLSFGFAVAAIFVTPIVASTLTEVDVRGRLPLASAIGVVVALPAIIFPSSATTAPDDSRRGGVVWSAVSKFPEVGERSALLPALAFVGGFACTILYFMLTRQVAILLATSLAAVAVVTSAGSQLYQKYMELPIGMFALIAIVSLYGSGRIHRTWPLLFLAILQAAMSAGIVGLPILRAL